MFFRKQPQKVAKRKIVPLRACSCGSDNFGLDGSYVDVFNCKKCGALYWAKCFDPIAKVEYVDGGE